MRESQTVLHKDGSLWANLPKLSAPAQRALAGLGVATLEELATFSETEIAQLHGIGPNAIIALRAALEAKGLSFASEK